MLLFCCDGWWLMCDEVYWNCSIDQHSWLSWTFWSQASSASESLYFYFTLLFRSLEPHLASVLHCCWFDERKDTQSVKNFIDWLIDWFVYLFIYWFIDWWIDLFIYWFIDWLIDWFWLVSLGWTRWCQWRSPRCQKKWCEWQLYSKSNVPVVILCVAY